MYNTHTPKRTRTRQMTNYHRQTVPVLCTSNYTCEGRAMLFVRRVAVRRDRVRPLIGTPPSTTIFYHYCFFYFFLFLRRRLFCYSSEPLQRRLSDPSSFDTPYVYSCCRRRLHVCAYRTTEKNACTTKSESWQLLWRTRVRPTASTSKTLSTGHGFR